MIVNLNADWALGDIKEFFLVSLLVRTAWWSCKVFLD